MPFLTLLCLKRNFLNQKRFMERELNMNTGLKGLTGRRVEVPSHLSELWAKVRKITKNML